MANPVVLDNGLFRFEVNGEIPPGRPSPMITGLKINGAIAMDPAKQNMGAGGTATLRTTDELNPTLGGDCAGRPSTWLGCHDQAGVGMPAMSQYGLMWTARPLDFLGIGGGGHAECEPGDGPVMTPYKIQMALSLGDDLYLPKQAAMLGMAFMILPGGAGYMPRGCSMPAFFLEPSAYQWVYICTDGTSWKPFTHPKYGNHKISTWKDHTQDGTDAMACRVGLGIMLASDAEAHKKANTERKCLAFWARQPVALDCSNRKQKNQNKPLIHIALTGDPTGGRMHKAINTWRTKWTCITVGGPATCMATYRQCVRRVGGWGDWHSAKRDALGGGGGMVNPPPVGDPPQDPPDIPVEPRPEGYSDHHGKPNQKINGISWDKASLRTGAAGTDNFPICWAADGHQYVVGGDGNGFQNGSRAEVILSRLGKAWPGTRGAKDLYRTGGKCYGITGLNSHVYLFVGRYSAAEGGSMERPMRETYMDQVTLTGRRVKRVRVCGWGDGTFLPAFIGMGKNHQYAFNEYIHALFPWGTKRKFEIQETDASGGTLARARSWDVGENKGVIFLGRIKRSDLEAMRVGKPYWQFYHGNYKLGKESWGPVGNWNAKKPVAVTDKCLCLGAVYNPHRNRYMLVTPYSNTPFENDSAGHFQVLDAPRPWGPYRTVGHWPGLLKWCFFMTFAEAWFSGNNGAAVYTGIGENDRYNTMKFTLR